MKTGRTDSSGERSVALGGDLHGNIHTGDVFYQTIDSAPKNISQYIRVHEFKTLINERTKSFVGREFIFEAIDTIIADENFESGYIVLQGEPGIGKTALSAELIKRRGYVHHFNIASQNIRSIRQFLANIYSQLIIRYGLPYDYISDEMLNDSGFLSRVLA